MNLLVLEEREKISDNQYALDERKSSHIIQILKSKPGDYLNSGLLDQKYGIFEIEKIEYGKVFGRFFSKEEKKQDADFPKIRLYSSIQRPQTVKKILQLSGSFGIQEIYFFLASKAEKSYLNSPVWKKENLTKEILLGLEQGKNIFSPTVRIIKNLNEISQISDSDFKLLFHPNGKPMTSFKNQIQKNKTISLLIGPEGGFRDTEIENFQKFGFQILSLSKSILRSETAYAFAIAQLELMFFRD